MAIRGGASRARRTKAEVEESFEKIKEESHHERQEFNPKAADLARQREDEVKQALKEITSESLAQRIASLRLDVSEMLSDVSAKLAAENELLGSLREAVGFERKELERLHKLDVAATALDQLIADHEEKKAALESEAAAARAKRR